YTLTAVDNNVAGNTGLPAIAADGGNTLTINGNGSTIQRSSAGGTPNFRIFLLTGGKLILDSLTIANGLTTQVNGKSCKGGGIFVQTAGSTLTVANSVITGNASATAGGPIMVMAVVSAVTTAPRSIWTTLR